MHFKANLCVDPFGSQIETFNILKINDMGLLADAYMTKGELHRGEEEAAKVMSDRLFTALFRLISCSIAPDRSY